MRSRRETGAPIRLAARRWRRRLASLEHAYPPPHPATAAGINPALLTPEERWELGRIMAIVERVGLAGCSEAEVELLLCFRLKLQEQSDECCLCGERT